MSGSWTIGRKLYAGIGALLVLLVGVGALAYSVTTEEKAALDTLVKATARRLELATTMASEVEQMQSAQRRLLISALRSDASRLEQHRRDVADNASALSQAADAIQPLLETNDGRRALSDVRDQLRTWQSLNGQLNDAITAANLDLAVSTQQDRSTPAIGHIQASISTIVDIERRRMRDAVTAADARSSASRLYILALIALSLAVGAGLCVAVRNICRALWLRASELRDGAQQLVAAASHVAGSSQSLSQGSTQQAASLEQTSASMEEMASMTRQNAENSQQAASLMVEVDRRVSESNGALAAMVSSMSGIQESSAKVAKIIKTIDEIAFQTNILALNAAVEAARAGEAGMGFAVVADEVRNLAQRSAQAAKDTAVLIEESGTNAQQGSATVSQVAETIAGITTSVSHVKGLVDQVSLASQQQAQGIDQVTQALTHMEKVTQTTAATAEESAAASEELNAQAESSMVVVRQLEAMVDGGAESAASSRQAQTSHRPRGGRPAMRAVTPMKTAEEQIPLTTGTYGTF